LNSDTLVAETDDVAEARSEGFHGVRRERDPDLDPAILPSKPSASDTFELIP
jgi:hypothetical protein